MSLESFFSNFFFENYWEKKIFHIKERNFINSNELIDEIDFFLSRKDVHLSNVRIVTKGIDIPSKLYSYSSRNLKGVEEFFVEPLSLITHFNEGGTIVINSANESISILRKLCFDFEKKLNMNFQANIYITPPNSQGFKPHYDNHDIFLFQVKGTKLWNFYKDGFELATNFSRKNEVNEIDFSLSLEEEDLLYLPRGIVHEAFSENQSSIHVNFIGKPRYGFNLVEDFANLVQDKFVFFRKTMPTKYSDNEEKQKYLSLFKENIKQVIDNFSFEDFNENLSNSHYKTSSLNLSGRFRNIIEVDNITEQTEIKANFNMCVLIKEENGDLIIKLKDIQMIIPKIIDSSFVNKLTSFKVKEIQGLLSNKGKIEFAKQLIRFGVFEIVDLT